MIKSHRPWKATASACERRQLMACLDRDVCHWAWHAVDERSLELCVCVCGRRKEKLGECVSDRRRRCLWVCETKEGVHEVTSRQLFDFPSFPGKQFQEQCRRKTTNHRQLKCHKEKEEEEEKKPPVLFVGDWIIAVPQDWRRRGKCVSDCTVLVADTYHLPDSSTHPSPSTPHNSRNTLKKE